MEGMVSSGKRAAIGQRPNPCLLPYLKVVGVTARTAGRRRAPPSVAIERAPPHE
jgi:hypothetical protein